VFKSVPRCIKGIPGHYGMFRGIMGCSRGVPGLLRAVRGGFRGCSGDVPGCSEVFRGVPGFTDTQQLQSTGEINIVAKLYFSCVYKR